MNVDNRTIFCHDNLEVLRGMNSRCVDLIYLDPPFNKKKTFTASIGSSAEGVSFSDIFREEDVKEDWLKDIKEDHYSIHELLNAVKNIEGKQSYNFCYLAYMAIRLMECHRVLKDTGSLYLHCDPTMSHYLKLVLDCILGEKNFRNEIIWWYSKWTAPSTMAFQKNNDIILFYTKTEKAFFKAPQQVTQNLVEKYKKGYLIGGGAGSKGLIIYDKENKKAKSLAATGRYTVRYEEKKGRPLSAVWDMAFINPMAKERTGYPTQKPITLIERIIKASSNEGDMVLDPFCGCATTCVASEKLNRQWIGIDVSVKAYELVKERLEKEVRSLFAQNIGFSTSPPLRTDQGVDYLPQKYVYIISNPQYEGEYKVGIASNVKSRLNSYQTADPERKYKLEYTHLTPYFREIEAYIHEKYENKHEWVKGNLEDIKKDIKGFLL